MISYILLTILLAFVFPGLCYFGGFIELYIKYGTYISGFIIFLWILIDAIGMGQNLKLKSEAKSKSKSKSKTKAKAKPKKA